MSTRTIVTTFTEKRHVWVIEDTQNGVLLGQKSHTLRGGVYRTLHFDTIAEANLYMGAIKTYGVYRVRKMYRSFKTER